MIGHSMFFAVSACRIGSLAQNLTPARRQLVAVLATLALVRRRKKNDSFTRGSSKIGAKGRKSLDRKEPEKVGVCFSRSNVSQRLRRNFPLFQGFLQAVGLPESGVLLG
jgi:hypothetical protein